MNVHDNNQTVSNPRELGNTKGHKEKGSKERKQAYSFFCQENCVKYKKYDTKDKSCFFFFKVNRRVANEKQHRTHDFSTRFLPMHTQIMGLMTMYTEYSVMLAPKQSVLDQFNRIYYAVNSLCLNLTVLLK